MKIYQQIPNLVKIGHLTCRPKYVVLLPETLNLHKDVFFGWNGVRLIRRPRKFKNYANAL